ncbi:hypothetical protein [Nocardia concava]|uniref:hypothetical protein n=1 Tax=Nocardia concava TaxID=257281 RepID=UPI0003063307|nr:hypothetical protein [Nocardia concava]
MTVRRGEIWRYQAVMRERIVLVVSCDPLNEDGRILVMDILDFEPPGPRRMVTVDLAPHGYGYGHIIGVAPGDRFLERLGIATGEQMTAVKSVLLSVFDLHD